MGYKKENLDRDLSVKSTFSYTNISIRFGKYKIGKLHPTSSSRSQLRHILNIENTRLNRIYRRQIIEDLA